MLFKIKNIVANKSIFFWIEIFILITGLALMSGIIFEHRWFMTFDGPAHVGNVRLMTELWRGDIENVQEYYQFTTFPQPNWTGHLVMTIFSFFLHGSSAEKATLFVLMLSMVFSFRYLLRSFQNDNPAQSLLILPVCFGMFFYFGSYNFCFSIVFLLLSLGFLQRSVSKLNFLRLLIIFLLSGLTYFSHLSALPVLAVVSTGILLFHAWETSKHTISAAFSIFVKKQLLLIIPHLPFIILVYLYQKQFGSDNYIYLSVSEIFQFIFDGAYLIGFGNSELIFTRTFTILLYSITFITILRRSYYWKNEVQKIKLHDLFFLASIFVLILVFILPDSDTKGGMVTTRLLTFHAVFLTIWLCLSTTPAWSKILFPIVVLVVVYFRSIDLSNQSNYQRYLANEVEKAAQFIDAGDVVLPVNRGDHWLTVNHPLLLGADKPVVVIENYEVWHGYFPVSDAKNSPMPAFPPRVRDWFCAEIAPVLFSREFIPDHIFIQESSFSFPCDSTLNLFIEMHYDLKYSSQVCSLYTLKANE